MLQVEIEIDEAAIDVLIMTTIARDHRRNDPKRDWLEEERLDAVSFGVTRLLSAALRTSRETRYSSLRSRPTSCEG